MQRTRNEVASKLDISSLRLKRGVGLLSYLMMDMTSKDSRFQLTWGAGISASDEELIADLRRVADGMKVVTVSNRAYQKLGRFSHTTLADRFGGWNGALLKAGLSIKHSQDIPDELLFLNLEKVWMKLGRQPRRREMAPDISEYSWTPYARRFRSWRKALESFVEFVNSTPTSEASTFLDVGKRSGHRTNRDPSLRLRFLVMRRDHFKCCHCGRSPATDPRVILHVDHIDPWSGGGETVMDNLKTLCQDCNLGKSNLPETESS